MIKKNKRTKEQKNKKSCDYFVIAMLYFNFII